MPSPTVKNYFDNRSTFAKVMPRQIFGLAIYVAYNFGYR